TKATANNSAGTMLLRTTNPITCLIYQSAAALGPRVGSIRSRNSSSRSPETVAWSLVLSTRRSRVSAQRGGIAEVISVLSLANENRATDCSLQCVRPSAPAGLARRVCNNGEAGRHEPPFPVPDLMSAALLPQAGSAWRAQRPRQLPGLAASVLR